MTDQQKRQASTNTIKQGNKKALEMPRCKMQESSKDREGMSRNA
jgi:hypothetical protein